MRKPLRVLDDLVANQIAAGEVVERPASVVKELVENAIDAGATEITVVLANGGRRSIEVSDNGCGMSKEEALVAIERFGTSKISQADDLNSIATLGFRGEALPSMAAVSVLTLVSSVGESGTPGVRLEIEGGHLKDIQAVSSPQGTKISVDNLFFNVPARRRFLRAEKTEISFVRNLIADFAAAYPELRFRYVADGVTVLNIANSASFEDRVAQLKLAGKEPIRVADRQLTSVGDLEIFAVLSQPEQAIAGSGKLRTIVNGRVVRDRLLLSAVREGYGNFLKGGQYPVGVLKLNIPPSEVDVNVHPQKAEVRFRSSQGIFALISRAIRKTFDSQGAVRHLQSSGTSGWQPDWRANYVAAAPEFSTYGVHEGRVLNLFSGPDVQTSTDPDHALRTMPQLSNLRFVGQIFECYLLMEGNEQLVIVDMHAAHERIRFYELSQQFASGNIATQGLLAPELVELEPEQIGQLLAAKESLTKLGIEFEQFGDNAVMVRGLPAILGNCSAVKLLADICALPEWSDWNMALDQQTGAVLARLACHGSVRSGVKLERAEVYKLLERMEEVERGAFCPHGRPVLCAITHAEMETMFGRR